MEGKISTIDLNNIKKSEIIKMYLEVCEQLQLLKIGITNTMIQVGTSLNSNYLKDLPMKVSVSENPDFQLSQSMNLKNLGGENQNPE